MARERLAVWDLLMPPRHPEALGDAAGRRAQRYKCRSEQIAIGIDVAIWLALRGLSGVSQIALDRFAAINIALLALDCVTGELVLRYARGSLAWRVHLAVSAIILIGTSLMWIQLTGSLTSYFLVCGLILVFWLRSGFDYWTGLVATLTLIIGHVLIIAFERWHWVRPMSLFAAPPGGVYASRPLQWLIVGSMTQFYVGAFIAANFVVRKFREKDAALAEAKRHADRSALGRFSGRTLADRYELGPIIGRGGMGAIYRGRRLSDGADVAIKILHSHLSVHTVAVQRFQREAQAASLLAGKRTPRVLETGTAWENEPFIVMEFLRTGRTWPVLWPSVDA